MDAQSFIKTITDMVKAGATDEQISAAYAAQSASERDAWEAQQMQSAADAQAAAAAKIADDDTGAREAEAEAEKRAAYFRRLTPVQIANCGLSNGMPADQVYAKCTAIYPDA